MTNSFWMISFKEDYNINKQYCFGFSPISAQERGLKQTNLEKSSIYSIFRISILGVSSIKKLFKFIFFVKLPLGLEALEG